jgi:tetratricopeptide (TPR) repeat protein
MASIIEGYSYDIFISYRQKDNKHDSWVTEFYDNLKGELESTFKEEISVYFDINPHDGLLETHDVDASLKDKLKCLVFIPIISRTYCDPKSFAWEHEFKAFIEQASLDQFGLKVKLLNGNVTSRLLPIRIHDLDPEDIRVVETYLGFIRPVDFIYHSQGVNRPLRQRDDDMIKNPQQPVYRDQINKVANAIKEIISGLKTGPVEPGKEKIQNREALKEVKKEEKSVEPEKPVRMIGKWLSGIFIIVILVIAVLLVYKKVFKPDKLDNLRSSDGRISVVVMPFQNMTNDTIWNVWQDGIQDILVTYLSNSPEELKVRQVESVDNLIKSKGLTNYASITPSVASTISQKLEANVFIYGSIKQAGATIRLNAQLIDSKTEETIKSFEIDAPSSEDIIFQISDSLKRMVKNSLIITKLEKELPVGFQYYESTNSPEAFRYFIYGQRAFNERDFPAAVKLFSQAIAIDSNFSAAYYSLGFSYGNQGMLEEAKKICLRFYEKRNQLPMQLKIKFNRAYAICFETPFEEIKYLKQLQELDDQVPVNYYNLGETYIRIYQYEKAIPEFEKALEIYNKWGSKPMWTPNYTLLGMAYHKTGQYKKEEKLYKKAEQDFPDDPDLIYRQAILSLSKGDTVTANRYIEKYKSILKDNSISGADIITNLALMYSEADIPDKAEEYYRKALSLDPGNILKKIDLAYFLIDKDKNVNEGMELVDKVLKLSPDNYLLLNTKGWGLYKQGKYEQALKILEKTWDLKPVYDHQIYLHLEEVKKVFSVQKNH